MWRFKVQENLGSVWKFVLWILKGLDRCFTLMLSCDKLLGDGRRAISAVSSMSRSGLHGHQHVILEGSVPCW